MLKTDKVVEWVVVNNRGVFWESLKNRKDARLVKNLYNTLQKDESPFRIAKVVVSK